MQVIVAIRFSGIFAAPRERNAGWSGKYFVNVWVPRPAHNCPVLPSMTLEMNTACPLRDCRYPIVG